MTVLSGWDGQTVRLSMTGVPERNSPFSVWSPLVFFLPSCRVASFTPRPLRRLDDAQREEDLARSPIGAAVCRAKDGTLGAMKVVRPAFVSWRAELRGA